MEPHLDKLSTNNDLPPETVMQEVKASLAAPMQELANIDLEIGQLENRLKSLTEKRDTIQKAIDKYIAILSPIRRIPSDILHEIFRHCLPIHRNPIMSNSEAPMLLTRVCSLWRSIAMSSPRLWAQLHITFCDNYRHRDPEIPEILNGLGFANSHLDFNAAPRVHAEKTLRMRCDVVKEWLSRSGTRSLSISLFYSSMMWTESELESVGPITLELFKNLLLFKERWGEIELTMPLEIYRKFEAMVSADILPMLTVFKGGFHEQIPGLPLPGFDPVVILKAPNLERVSLSGPAELWSPSNIPLTAWTEKLTYLCYHSPLSIIDAFILLKHLHNLEHFKIFILGSIEDPEDPRLQGLFSLPHLQSLCILEDSTNPAIMTRLYDNIDAPSLKWIDYQKYTNGLAQNELTDSDVLSPVLSLLGKSNHVTKLTLDPNCVSPWNMRRILQCGSHLTHLVLGQEPTGPFRILSDTAQFLPPGAISGQESFLELLTIHKNDSGSPSETILSSEILLPALEVLEVSAGSSQNLSDHKVLQFITSRMDPYSPHGIAVLKHVRILFNRVKEMDIAEQVTLYRDARSGGIELGTIKLDLVYLYQLGPEYLDTVLSPSSGLTEDGRSWVYPDIVDTAVPTS